MLKYTDYTIVFQEIPDEITLAINISGCPNRCKGCHSPYLMEDIGEELTPQTVLSLIEKYTSSITCVCFMGGDHAPEEIECLIEYIRHQYDIKIGWYSGGEIFPQKIYMFDYVKLGPYVEERGGLRNPNTNQRLYSIQNTHADDITYKFW